MSFRVVENVIHAFSKNKRFLTRDRLLALAGLASHFLTLASNKKPSWIPFREAFASLTKVDEQEPVVAQSTTQTRIVQQIHMLREKVEAATKTEKVKIRAQIDALVDLLQG